MNVLFSSDDNYAQHLGVAIRSLLNNNAQNEINIYIVDNGISVKNKERLNTLASSSTNCQMNYILFAKWKSQLHLSLCWDISLSSYARLFMSSMLPSDVERVIYMDCDMIVCQDLSQLWNTNLQGNVIGAVQDTVSSPKESVGMTLKEPYFNAGMLLVDIKAWREQGCEKKCLDFIEEHKGNVIHHDQGVLNGVFRNKWTRLPIAYNLMTIHFLFSQHAIKKFYNDESDFYDEKVVQEAVEKPIILHFTPSMTTRPWIRNCKHPKRFLYWSVLDQTPWRGAQVESDTSKWYVKVINWWYRVTLK